MKEKMTRREFIKFCFKSAVLAGMMNLIPFQFGFADEEKKKFVIKVKPLKRADIYRKNDLAG
jgi:hypothetical protein